MNTLIQGFLDNDSFFGKFMTKLGIIIGANLMFVLCSIPGVTIGAGLVALYHVMLKVLRGNRSLNPFKEFWIGFKNNFKQATICWIGVVLLFALGYVDVRFLRSMGGVMASLQYVIYAMGIVAAVLFCFLLPVMAAFADTIPNLLRNALFFACMKPAKTLVILFFDIFPLFLTYSDPQDMPLYVFLWFLCGFGLIAMLGSTLLFPSFVKYLPGHEDMDEAENLSPLSDEDAMMDELQMLDGV